ncbi:MAG: hypothetical protein LBH01_02060 [Verrucomicrobiales bacterium]|jgi:hypothetical protein|nr:hypothetical protein [Verrucomicrobiales bacterium]
MPRQGMSENGYRQYGDQSYEFGLDSEDALAIANAIGLKPESLEISGEPEFTAEGKNQNGLTAAFAVGDPKYSFTMGGYLVDKAKFAAAADFTYDGRFFIITSPKENRSNTEFAKCEIGGVSYPLIGAPAAGGGGE